MELVLQKLQLTEILIKEKAWLQTLRSEHNGKDKKYTSKPVSDSQCVSSEHYCSIRHKTEGEAEKKLISIAQQSQFETNEETANTSRNSGSGIEALELYTVTDTACKPSALPEKLNSALNNIRKIRDRNTCEVVEHHRDVTKRKSAVKNKKRKRKSWISSGSNEAAAVENDTGADDLEKESRMEEIMKQEIRGVKIPSTEHDPLSMKTSDGALADEKLEQLDSWRQKLLFTKEHTQKVADTAEDIQACTPITDVLDKAPCNMQTPQSSKVSSSTLQKLQQFKRTSSYIDSVSQNIADQKSLVSVREILESKKDTSTGRVKIQCDALNDLVNYGKKLSSSRQSSGSSFSNSNGLTSLDGSLSKLPQNSTQAFSTGGDDFEDLDFSI